MDGYIPLYKPPGITSQKAVSRVRKLLNIKKAGHTGTLDPAAEGLLLIGLNRATRLNEYLLSSAKEYRAVVRFGLATDSGDREGAVIERLAGFSLDPQAVAAAMRKLTGEIRQVPPSASAIKIKGQRAYELYRQGTSVDMPSRLVTIYWLERLCTPRTIEPGFPRLVLQVRCSKGTYIRSLAMDLGKELGCPAYLEALVRTRIGPVGLDLARTFATVTDNPGLLDMKVAVSELPPLILKDSVQESDFLHGRKILVSMLDAEAVAVYFRDRLLGIGRILGGAVHPAKVLR